MASRIPRLFQRVVYRHRRSINLLCNESRELAKRLKVGCIEPPTTFAFNTRHISSFSNNFNDKQQQRNQFQFTLNLKHDMSTLSKSQKKNCIEFETFNHPKIDMNVFEKNLKKFWHFEPKTKHKINNNHIEAIEFEHESGSPCYPTIIVNQLHYEKLSKNTKEVIDRMIHTIPNNQALNPSTSENFLVCGRIWEPISNEQFDLVRSESKFAAGLSVAGIFPKKSFLQSGNAHVSRGVNNQVIMNKHNDEPQFIMRASEMQAKATQAGIDFQHVNPNTSLQPTAMVTFREMLATNGAHDDYMSREIVHRF